MVRILFIGLLLFQSNVNAQPIKSEFKINKLSMIPEKVDIVKFSKGSIYFNGTTLFIKYKDKILQLVSNTKGQGMSGNEVLGVELWDTYSDKGIIVGVVMRDWYQAASNYGETLSLVIFQLTDRSKLSQPIKIGEVELGSSGKGFNKIGDYIIKSGSRSYKYDLVVLHARCDYILNGQKCIKKEYEVDLVNSSMKVLDPYPLLISPSFSCEAKTNYIENIICHSSLISNLDSIMSKLYKESTLSTKKKEQKTWLKKRNACESSSTKLSQLCLIREYNNQIDHLIINR